MDKNFVYTYPERETEKMSSVIVYFDKNVGYMGADSRCIDSLSYKIKDDNKDKIVIGSNFLVAATGRSSFILDGKEVEIEKWLSSCDNLSDILFTAHEVSLQLNSKEHTNFMILYKKGTVHYLDVHITKKSVLTNEWEAPGIIASGVCHCANFNKLVNATYKDIPDLIRFDQEIEEIGGRKSVGGEIKVWKISDTIEKVSF